VTCIDFRMHGTKIKKKTGNMFETFIHIHEYCFGLCASKSILFIFLDVCTAIYCTYCADNKKL